MHYTLKKISTLLIDADNFWSQPKLLKQIIDTVEQYLDVKLISRYHDTPHHYPARTVVPKTIYEFCNFELQLKRVIDSAEPNSVVYLCNSIESLEQTRSLLCGTIFYRKHDFSLYDNHLLYMESPDFVVDSLDDLFACLSSSDVGFHAEATCSPHEPTSNLPRTTFQCSPITYPVQSPSDPLNLISQSTVLNNSAPPFPTIAPTALGAAPPTYNNAPSPISALAPSLNSATAPSTISAPAPSLNSAPSANSNSTQVSRVTPLPNLEFPDSPFWVQGRYFSHLDPRHELHQLSKNLWSFKRHHNNLSELFAQLFLDGIETAMTNMAPPMPAKVSVAIKSPTRKSKSPSTIPPSTSTIPLRIARSTRENLIYVTQVPSRPEVGDRLKHCLTLMQKHLENQPLLIQQFTESAQTRSPDNLTAASSYSPNTSHPAHSDNTNQLSSHSKNGSSKRKNTLRKQLNTPTALLNAEQIRPDILRCVKNYRTLKTLGLKARKAAVANAFCVQEDVAGKHIIIIDDIVTTGATMNECIRTLRAAGASRVTPIVMAFHPYAIQGRVNSS